MTASAIPSVPRPAIPVNQNGVIAAALLIGFLVYITIKGRMAAYINLLFSSRGKPPSKVASSQTNKTGTGQVASDASNPVTYSAPGSQPLQGLAPAQGLAPLSSNVGNNQSFISSMVDSGAFNDVSGTVPSDNNYIDVFTTSGGG